MRKYFPTPLLPCFSCIKVNKSQVFKTHLKMITCITWPYLYMYHNIISINSWNKYYRDLFLEILVINVEQILYNICSGELLLYTVWFLLELILCGTNIQSQLYRWSHILSMIIWEAKFGLCSREMQFISWHMKCY
jgi:hypothetical protein